MPAALRTPATPSWLIQWHGLSDGPERLSLSAQSDHFAGRLLLGLMRNELAAVATTETEGEFPTEISFGRL
jgi:hypothetical protein